MSANFGAEIGTLRPGTLADITILEVREGSFVFGDSTGKKRTGKQKLQSVAAIRAGKAYINRSDDVGNLGLVRLGKRPGLGRRSLLEFRYLNRRNHMRTRYAFLLLAVFGALVGLSAADDPMLGSWKLNVGKSKFGSGPAIQAETNQVEPYGGNGIKHTAQITKPDGTKVTESYAGTIDGK